MTKTDIPIGVKNTNELIVYQIGELKNIMLAFQASQEKLDNRLSALELYRAGQEEKAKNEPQIDLTKILLAAFGLIAAALAIIQSGVINLR